MVIDNNHLFMLQIKSILDTSGGKLTARTQPILCPFYPAQSIWTTFFKKILKI